MKKTRHKRKGILGSIYKRLFCFYGPQNWWPAKTRIEVIIGAILTQNTAWSNVEKAINNLKDKKMITSDKILEAKPALLKKLIRSSGYFNLKARRLKNFCTFLKRKYGNSLNLMFSEDIQVLRKELLKVKGLGQETVDSILLYAGKKPVFVVDAYTKRIFSRHKLINKKDKYEDIQNIFMLNLKNDEKFFNEYHALIVALGKNLCRKASPRCYECPLKGVNNFPR